MMVLTIFKCNRLRGIWDGFRLEKPGRWWAGRHKTTASGRLKSSRPRYSNSREFQPSTISTSRAVAISPSHRCSVKCEAIRQEEHTRHGKEDAKQTRFFYRTRQDKNKLLYKAGETEKKQRTLSTPLSVNEGGHHSCMSNCITTLAL